MAHLFLSYAREDRECAELLARALSRRNWSVWWDRQIHVGRSFSEVIEEELDQARCVIVLWSRHSVKSEWVRSEAAEAARRGVLVPLRIEDVRPPLIFRQLHTADLFEWRKGFDTPDFEACRESIEYLIRKTASGKHAVATTGAEKTDTPQSDAKEAAPIAEKTRPTTALSEQDKQQPTRTDFWISQDGQQFQAPDAGTLRRWAEEGRIRADSPVYDPKLQRWMRAREMPQMQSAYQNRPVKIQRYMPAREMPQVRSPYQNRPVADGLQRAADSQASTGNSGPSHAPAVENNAQETRSQTESDPSGRTDFWINQDGQQFRAPDAMTLRHWAEEGRIRADSQVHDPKLQRWMRAREIPELQSAFANTVHDQRRMLTQPLPVILAAGLFVVCLTIFCLLVIMNGFVSLN